MNSKKDFFLRLAPFFFLGLWGCQSIEDETSSYAMAVVNTQGQATPEAPSYDYLTSLAASCDAEIQRLYGQRHQVPVGQAKSFSVALGNASQACQKLQNALNVWRQTAVDVTSYRHNTDFAQTLLGAAQSPQTSEDYFPEAQENPPAVSEPDLAPTHTLTPQPLAAEPLS